MFIRFFSAQTSSNSSNPSHQRVLPPLCAWKILPDPLHFSYSDFQYQDLPQCDHLTTIGLLGRRWQLQDLELSLLLNSGVHKTAPPTLSYLPSILSGHCPLNAQSHSTSLSGIIAYYSQTTDQIILLFNND